MPVCVLLDDIRSMLNVGSIFRSCDAFLVEKLYLCGITAQPPHREINKTALGATESVAWEHRENIAGLVDELKAKGYKVIGMEQTSQSVLLNDFEFDANQRYALVMGNEVEGISERILPKLDVALEIPQEGTKHSLNVSVAAGIAMYKFFEALNSKR